MNLSEWAKRDNDFKKSGILTQTLGTKLIHDTDFYFEIYGKVCKNINNPPSNSYVELTNYRKNVPALIQFIDILATENDRLMKICKRFNDDNKEKSHKKWTDTEDETLIELVCDDAPMLRISLMLGRSVPAIKTRLTYLVGVKRLSQKVAGKFIGIADGEKTELQLEGTLYKD